MNVRSNFVAPQREADIGAANLAIKEKIVQCTKKIQPVPANRVASPKSRRVTHSVFS
jgi:hypothetical protein